MFLLPPSETKFSATGKTKLQLKNLSFPELTKSRTEVLDALIDVSKSPTKARTLLAISEKLDFERVRNTELKTAPAAAAYKIYAGVLYDAISANTLSAAAIKKLTSNVYVQSALFGLVSLGDVIPAYRLSSSTKLPKIGSLTNVWSKPCADIFENNNELIIDLRSGQYAALAPIPKAISDQVVVPKILEKMPSGPPKVVSHFNKATKGRIVRQVVTGSSMPKTVDQFAKIVAKLGADVEVVTPKKSGQPIGLNVIVSSL